jgi:hypothetical protein
MIEPQVSVVLPLFGDHHAVDTLPAVCRAWLAQRVPCEVVVGVGPGTPVRAIEAGTAEMDGRVRIVAVDSGSVSAGPLRNLAAEASRAPVLYLGDADVAPLGEDFLERALAIREDGAVIQPWMYRLVNSADLTDVPRFQPPGRGRFCHVSGDRDGRLTPVGGEQFTWLGPDMMVVEPPPGAGWAQADGATWRPPPYHWGGMLMDRKTFEDVGRYCTRYGGWGCEDDDLIVKLEGRTRVLRAWRAARRLTCLHFEHPRGHTSNDLAANRVNRKILAERLAAGAEAMIEEDLR